MAFVREQVGNRYILQERIGAGGMGAVYRALDRLTGETVALKRVTTPGEHLRFASSGASSDYRLSLAMEFRHLASLRHPHIISVLDYGFDAERQPYYTMELLHKPRTIVEAGRGQVPGVQLRLLIQLLQALAYLHRRGIIHRDLKPENVLVVNWQVKVVDFGLSVAREHLNEKENGTVGTLAYMAPEVLQGSPASEASDLYAFGIIAYEMIAGRYPYALTDTARLIADILTVVPDLNALNIDPRIRDVIGGLLPKDPLSRYSDAQELIYAYMRAAGQPIVIETPSIRESYLQAARFVGRTRELATLKAALEKITTHQGDVGESLRPSPTEDADSAVGVKQGAPLPETPATGSSWLIGGESGVGKSRLLEELRIQALVSGVLVVQGQGISAGGAPFQLWRDVIRHLCLHTAVSDLEAGVLMSIVPDIGALLGRSIPDAPALDPTASQARLHAVIEELFRRQNRPVLVILEDLHWAADAHECLSVLQRLNRIVHELPLLIVGNYRNDECPDLPDKLRDMQVIELQRLSEIEIARLSESILGEAGTQPDLIDLIKRETEGNLFFIVEVVRTLAEDAGELSLVGKLTLPQHVFAEGMKTVIERRLSRVPDEAYYLLKVAAVVGRELDLRLLQHLTSQREFDEWLLTCELAAVLEVYDNRWRFAHDKLREGMLGLLTPAEFRALHLQVAQGLEAVYPDDPAHMILTAYHWEQAIGDGSDMPSDVLCRAAASFNRAGQQAAANFAYHETIHYYQLALALEARYPDHERDPRRYLDPQEDKLFRARRLRVLADAHFNLGTNQQARVYIQQALGLLGGGMNIAAVRRLSGAALILRYLLMRPARLRTETQQQRFFEDEPILREKAMVYSTLSHLYRDTGDTLSVAWAGSLALTLLEAAGAWHEVAVRYSEMSVAYSELGFQKTAKGYRALALQLAADFQDRVEYVEIRNNVSMVAYNAGLWAEAQAAFEENVAAYARFGADISLLNALIHLAFMAYERGAFQQAEETAARAAAHAHRSDNLRYEVAALNTQAQSLLAVGQYENALRLLRKAITIPAEQIRLMVQAYGLLALVYAQTGETQHAAATIQEALALPLRNAPGFPLRYLAEPALVLWESTGSAAWRHTARRACKALIRATAARISHLPAARRSQGLCEWLSGKSKKAQRAWADSLNHAQSLQMPYEEALTRHMIGRLDPTQAEQRTQAAAIFERLGAICPPPIAKT